jgi:large subunit ribosomal protein L19e
MKLEKKKALVARTLNVGKGRIVFNTQRLSELKEAITKQDIKDLKESGVIIIKEEKGRKRKPVRKTRRRMGSVKKKINAGKKKYVTLTRKLRAHLFGLKRQNKIDKKNYSELRKHIRASNFRNLAHMKEYITQLSNEEIKHGVKHAKNTKTKKTRSKN